jgi:hypothetical protein
VGILHGSTPPFRSILCLVPMAACSCFSTAAIFYSNSTSCFDACMPGCADVFCCVEQSFNCSTTFSTSCNRCSFMDVLSSKAFIYAAILAGVAAAWVRVDLGGAISFTFALSSCAAIRATRSSTILSRCSVLSCCSLFISF